jgi:hypothetical protein
VEKKNKRIEKPNDEGWISDLAFFVDVTGHLNTLNKELQGKDKLITEIVGFEVLIALMMEAARTSETLVNVYQTTRCYNPEYSHLHYRDV